MRESVRNALNFYRLEKKITFYDFNFGLKTKADLLPSEGTTLCETSLATSRLAQNCRAASADDDGLCMREDGGDSEASGAFDIHEK